jgi:hypothetical protein
MAKAPKKPEDTQEDRVCQAVQSIGLLLTRAGGAYRVIDPRNNAAIGASGTLDELEARLKAGSIKGTHTFGGKAETKASREHRLHTEIEALESQLRIVTNPKGRTDKLRKLAELKRQEDDLAPSPSNPPGRTRRD